jgi:hypothetical protein
MSFVFPQDINHKAGAVRVTQDGANFYVPVVLFCPDGLTPLTVSNPLPVQSVVGGAAVSASNPLPAQLANVNTNNPLSVQTIVGGNPVSASNPLPAELVGSAVKGPMLANEQPYSAFPANTTTYWGIPQSLSRNAKARTFIFYNTMDQPITCQLFVYDSTINDTYSLVTAISLSQIPATHGLLVATSESYPNLAAHVDSFFMSGQMGSTAPTQGQLKIYVVEVF